MKTDWIQTFTGRKIYPLAPEIEEICIEDIAHSLANQCRYNGHCKEFYSVAQHSITLSRHWFKNTESKRYALLHDASEAYLSDVPRPIKHLPQFQFYRDAEDNLQELIYVRFGLNPFQPEEIKRCDWELLCEEAMSPKLMSPLHPEWKARCEPLMSFTPVLPKKAEQMFLDEFETLFEGNYK